MAAMPSRHAVRRIAASSVTSIAELSRLPASLRCTRPSRRLSERHRRSASYPPPGRREPVVERVLRAPAERTRGERVVEDASLYLAEPRLRELWRALRARSALDRVIELEDGGLPAGAAVEHASVVAAAVDLCLHAVAHEAVVARLAAVAVDRRCAAVAQAPHEDRHHARLAV